MDFKLPEEQRNKLLGIVKQMETNGEPPERIQRAVDLYKNKYVNFRKAAVKQEAEKAPEQLDPVQFGKQKVIDPLLNMVGKAGSALDRFGGAPTRAAANEIINPSQQYLDAPFKNISQDPLIQAPKAFINQFGRNPANAPTMKQVFTERGLSDRPLSERRPSMYSESGKGIRQLKKGGILDFSPAGVAGLAGDVLTDVTNLIPLGTAAKIGAKGVKKGVGLTAKGTGKAIDYATDTNVMQKIGAGRKAFTESIGEGVKKGFTGKKAGDYGKYKAIAQRNGIAPNELNAAVKHGKESTLSRVERHAGEGPEGEKIRKANTALHQKIDKSLIGEVNKISNNQALKQNQAGQVIVDGFDRGVKKAFDELDVTYSSLLKDMPDLMIDPKAFQKMDNRIKAISDEMVFKAEKGASTEARNAAKQVLNNIKSITETQGDYQDALRMLREIGESSFSTGRQFKIPPNEKAMRDLYGTLRDALTETADSIDPLVGKQLRNNNKIMSQLMGDKSALAKTLKTEKSTEQIFKSIIMNGNTKTINALKRFLTPEELKAAKGTYLKSIMKENIEGDYPARTIYNKLRDVRQTGYLDELFDAGELDNLSDLLNLKDRVGIPILSTSGTGGSNAFLNMVKETIPRAAESGVAKVITTKAPIKKSSTLRKVVKGTLKRTPKAAQVYSVQQRNQGRQ